MFRKKLLIVSLSVFLLFSSTANIANAGDIVFETVISWFQWWSEIHWGMGGFTRTSYVAISYTPTTDQEVCTVKPGLYKSGNPIDDVVMTVKNSSTVLGSVTLPASQVAGPPILPQQTTYTEFKFSPCLNLFAGIGYFFVISRTQVGSGGEYVSQLSNLISYPQVSFWGYVPVQGFQEKPAGYEPAFRLEGPDEPAKTPVLIIPGIAGSELKNGDDLIWADLGQMFLDINDQFLTENLGLDENGQPVDSNIKTGNVIEQLPDVPIIDAGAFNVDTFKTLREDLETNSYVLNQDLFYFSYDWRLDLTDTATLLKNKIDEIKLQTDSEKINIVAHSMGGLLAKEYINQNGKENIDKLIFVGTPHLGAPKAGKVILTGDKMGIPWLEKERLKELSKNYPAIHQLLPKQTYFDLVGPYIKKIFQIIPSEISSVLDYNQTKQFLIDQGSSQNVFDLAENFFNNNLEDLDLSGIKAYNIAGCTTATQGGYQVYPSGDISLVKYRAGDRTVPLVSGDSINLLAENKFYSTEGSHAELPSRPGVRNLIVDILDNQPLASYDNISNDQSTCGIDGQELIWRSPVEVHIYDSQNRHTGPIENGIEYGVPGVDYEIFGHEKFIFIPSSNGENYQVVAKGLDNGTFDLHIRQNSDGIVTTATVFNDIPVTTSTEVSFTTTGSPIGDIEVDQDGDGSFISIPATSILNGQEADDIIPPVIDILSLASLSYERSFNLPVTVEINDDNSGILSSQIKLDGNLFSSASIDLFFYSLGSHSLDIVATDKAGNTATKSFEFQVIATPNSVISDIERAYELGWIEKNGIKNSLINKLKSAIKIEKRIEILEEKLPDKPKVIKQIEKFVKRINKVLATQFLNQLEGEYNKGNLNEQAYNLLKEDVGWLISH